MRLLPPLSPPLPLLCSSTTPPLEFCWLLYHVMAASLPALFERLNDGPTSEPGHYRCLIAGCEWEREGVCHDTPRNHVHTHHPQEWAAFPPDVPKMRRALPYEKRVKRTCDADKRIAATKRMKRYRQSLKQVSHGFFVLASVVGWRGCTHSFLGYFADVIRRTCVLRVMESQISLCS